MSDEKNSPSKTEREIAYFALADFTDENAP